MAEAGSLGLGPVILGRGGLAGVKFGQWVQVYSFCPIVCSAVSTRRSIYSLKALTSEDHRVLGSLLAT